MSTTFWIIVAGVFAGSAAVAALAAFAGPAWGRWHAHSRRRSGDPVATPPGAWQLGEPALAGQVVTALCQLQHGLADSERPLPPVDAVLVGPGRLLVRLSQPWSTAPPDPWRVAAGDPGQCWLVDLAQVREWSPGPTPYPALTVAGQVDGWTLLVNLAQAPGLVSVTGQWAQWAVEQFGQALANSPWSRPVRLVRAGFEHPLPVAEPGRVEDLDTVAEAVAAAAVTARDGGGPLVLLLAEPPPNQHLGLLNGLAQTAMITVVCAGGCEPAGWRFDVTSTGTLRWESHGLLTNLTGRPELTAAVAPPPSLEAPGQAQVQVQVLGPLQITAPGSVEPPAGPALASLVAAAALHPAGLPAPLAAKLLPDPAAAARALHDWLGADPSGLPRLRLVAGRWRLSADVQADWRVFSELVSTPGSDEWSRLVTALTMIRGELLSGVPTPITPAATIAGQVRPLVVRAVERAVALAGQRGDYPNVEWALRQGLSLLPRDEHLWRTLLSFQEQYDRAALPATTADLLATLAAGLPGGRRVRLSRPTRQLLARLKVAPARVVSRR